MIINGSPVSSAFFFLLFFPFNTSVSQNHFCYWLLLTLCLCYKTPVSLWPSCCGSECFFLLLILRSAPSGAPSVHPRCTFLSTPRSSIAVLGGFCDKEPQPWGALINRKLQSLLTTWTLLRHLLVQVCTENEVGFIQIPWMQVCVWPVQFSKMLRDSWEAAGALTFRELLDT